VTTCLVGWHSGPARYILGSKVRILIDAFSVSPTLNDDCFCRLMTCISTKSFFVGPTLFIGFFVVHILLVESPNKRENVLFFVGINCCVFEPLTIFFSIEVKEFSKKKSCFFYFLKSFQVMIELFFFFFFFFLCEQT
jgi:hypothetical protein